MAKLEHFIIIGASHAGVQLAVSLRETGFAGEITLIGDDPHIPYHRPPLSKIYLKDPAHEVQVLRAAQYYSDHDITLKTPHRVTRLDAEAKYIEIDGKDKLPFTKLCIATGARPRPLDIAGIDAREIYQMRNAEDAKRIREAAKPHKKAVVVGGGFIGLEVASTLHHLGLEVTVIEMAPRLMGRAVAPEISQFVLEKYIGLGINVILNSQITGIQTDGGNKITAVECGNQSHAADMALIGVGVVPNDELAKSAGLETNNGILVDGKLRTSHEDIFAIGDVANYRHWLIDKRVRLESVQNATDQAKHLANVVAGSDASYGAVPWFWSQQADMKLQMVGLSHNSQNTVVRENPQRESFTVFHFDGLSKLIAIDTINAPAEHMAGRRLIANGLSPTITQAVDPEFSLKNLL